MSELGFKDRETLLDYIYKNLREEDWDAFIGFGVGLIARDAADGGDTDNWSIYGWQYALGFVAALHADPSPDLLRWLAYEGEISANQVAELAHFEPPNAPG